MLMPGRKLTLSDYRFGFNGKENDNEPKGIGNSLNFGSRIYDSRLGRWLSLDPLMKKYPDLTPYNFVVNSPIRFLEIDGKDFGMLVDHSSKTILITATFYTISEKTQSEATAAASNWNALTGTKIKIGGEEYTISVAVSAQMGNGADSKERFINAHSQSTTDIEGNTYNGSINGFPSEKKFGRTEGRSYTGEKSAQGKPLEPGLSDGKNITMPLYNMEGYEVYYGPRDKENSVEHEMGHNLGLDNPGGKYYTPGGAMDYSGPYKPSVDDLKDVIKYGLDGGGNAAKVHVNHQTDSKRPQDFKELKSSDVQ